MWAIQPPRGQVETQGMDLPPMKHPSAATGLGPHPGGMRASTPRERPRACAASLPGVPLPPLPLCGAGPE
ncbi:hypothetical protein IFM53868_06856 [Aspergillus udagawae]|uniref:Uncharacterized protein n=1 Tax=Aspergillus udagawae TaxID=91492 RepID=A0ABQ1B2E1_9EURO|nr:hypothetical protein IFM53868_06856 [Aspergillus udagawae]GFG10721.1 hypothetical protein IFM5058_05066 [Aspergillus udagawae]